MSVFFRLIKCFLIVCLFPILMVTLIGAYMIIPIILLTIDLFKYILTGQSDLTATYLFGEYPSLSEIISVGWAIYVVDRYNEKFLKDAVSNTKK